MNFPTSLSSFASSMTSAVFLSRKIFLMLLSKMLSACCLVSHHVTFRASLRVEGKTFSRRKLLGKFERVGRNEKSNRVFISQFVSVFSSCRKLKDVYAHLKNDFCRNEMKSGKDLLRNLDLNLLLSLSRATVNFPSNFLFFASK